MKLTKVVRSNTDYSRSLLHAAFNGARAAQENAFDRQSMGRLMARTTVNSVGLAMMGAVVGAAGSRICTTRTRTKQRIEFNPAISSALIGAAFGLSTGLLWNTRPLTEVAVRGAMKSVDAVRDAHWLARNPISFG